jgi:hypothetical protein
MARKRSALAGTMRHDFDAVRILALIRDEQFPSDHLARVLAEACHRIVQLERTVGEMTGKGSEIVSLGQRKQGDVEGTINPPFVTSCDGDGRTK